MRWPAARRSPVTRGRRTESACSDPDTAANAVFTNGPEKNFRYHHQPLGYFADYADGTVGRVEHLKDEQQFLDDPGNGNLPAVSFVKPVGSENEHPGYASEHTGSDHLVELLKNIAASPQAASTMVVVTYDEFGGELPPVPHADDQRSGIREHHVRRTGRQLPLVPVLRRPLRIAGLVQVR